MNRYAQVIVDVPARQTNRAFTYALPQHLQTVAKIGSRVSVPFASRLLQGIIIGFAEDSDIDEAKIKAIKEVSDVQPALTEELVTLSKWISDYYFCPRIASLYAMLPKALKARYEQLLAVDEQQYDAQLFFDAEEQQLIDWIRKRKQPTMSNLLLQFPHSLERLKHLIERGLVIERQQIADRQQTRKVRYVLRTGDAQLYRGAWEQTRSNAIQLRKLLAYCADDDWSERPLQQLCDELQIQPATIKTLVQRGMLQIEERESYRNPYEDRQFPASKPLPLNDEQQVAYDGMASHLRAHRHRTCLLKGVTGSGKTEVYLQLIQVCLDEGRDAVVLVPEIALTPQMVERFKSRFGDWVAVLHSRLSDGERYDEWRKIRRGQVRVAVGARSAVFAPFANLGLIVIDEEHESSYKQEESPKYVTRDVARQRCLSNDALLLLGSATPSLESYASAINGVYEMYELRVRARNNPLPVVQIVDMREEQRNGNRSLFSVRLQEALQDRIARREQVILLLNRRGYSTFVMCRECGYVCQCPHCEIALTYHQKGYAMHCHYCDYREQVAGQCPACGSGNIRFYGTGTQKIEAELLQLFPSIRVIRMDVDTTSRKGSHERLLQSFAAGEADVLLGTQMISKGLDFANVTLAGVITADTILNMPDFRAAEKTFQLLTQLAGRAGRAEKAGEVVIQTYNPEHYSIVETGTHNYDGFVGRELKYRESLSYPPFCRLLLFTLSHEKEEVLMRGASALAQYLRVFAESVTEHSSFQVLGPVRAPIAKLKDRYRYHCMVKYSGDFSLKELMHRTAKHMEGWIQTEKVTVSVDFDPQNMM
jgi:primosomal protein N' (replication factor Y)